MSGDARLDVVAALEARFQSALAELGAKADTRAIFRALLARYHEPHRVYHGVDHLSACFGELDLVRATLARPAEAELAIFCHDAVYATHPFANNEARSAALARRLGASVGVAADALDRVAAIVLATRDHREGTSAEETAVLDADLAILGAERSAYADYEVAIRREYGWVPDRVYRSTRAKLLRALLARPAIFGGAAARARLETVARRNVRGAVEQLATWPVRGATGAAET